MVSRRAQLANERPPEHSPPPKHQLSRRTRAKGAEQALRARVRGLSLFEGRSWNRSGGRSRGHAWMCGHRWWEKGGSSRKGGVRGTTFAFPAFPASEGIDRHAYVYGCMGFAGRRARGGSTIVRGVRGRRAGCVQGWEASAKRRSLCPKRRSLCKRKPLQQTLCPRSFFLMVLGTSSMEGIKRRL